MLRCLNCGRRCPDSKALQRHRWNEHGGDLDLGESSAEPERIDSLVENPVEPPRLEP